MTSQINEVINLMLGKDGELNEMYLSFLEETDFIEKIYSLLHKCKNFDIQTECIRFLTYMPLKKLGVQLVSRKIPERVTSLIQEPRVKGDLNEKQYKVKCLAMWLICNMAKN